MLAPISWLKDYVDINVSPEKLASKLVAIGFEVEEIVYQNKKAEKIVVGRITSVKQHPNADRLRVTQIDIGKKTIQVVTNVPVEGGETIAVALDGAKLADGTVIKAGELRGVKSEGMLCGLEEAGITVDDVKGQKAGDILRISPSAPLGDSALDALGYNDVILDIGVTANRPDCNSIYKLAKEVAVALGVDCREPEIEYKTVGGDINDCEVQRKFLQMLREKHGDKIKIGSKRLSELAIAANGTIVSDTVTGDDGEEICVLDTKGRVARSEIEALDELYAFVAAVDEAYEALQGRTKAIVQKLITVKFFELFGGVADVWSYVSGSAAINPELLKSLSVGVKPYQTQREIAAEFGRNEASVSTTFNRFMSDVKNILSRK